MARRECSHPTCGETCRRERPEVKRGTTLTERSRNAKPSLLKQAQDAFNAYIRKRDKDKPCVCGCGERVEHAGHFFPAGTYSGVRFDEMNVHGQARACNFFKNKTAIDPDYETGLIARVGMNNVLRLQEKAHKTKLYRWSREELQNIIEKYSAKVK